MKQRNVVPSTPPAITASSMARSRPRLRPSASDKLRGGAAGSSGANGGAIGGDGGKPGGDGAVGGGDGGRGTLGGDGSS